MIPGSVKSQFDKVPMFRQGVKLFDFPAKIIEIREVSTLTELRKIGDSCF
jgi:hypothetical protein